VKYRLGVSDDFEVGRQGGVRICLTACLTYEGIFLILFHVVSLTGLVVLCERNAGALPCTKLIGGLHERRAQIGVGCRAIGDPPRRQ
jgi:hypothetical protein